MTASSRPLPDFAVLIDAALGESADATALAARLHDARVRVFWVGGEKKISECTQVLASEVALAPPAPDCFIAAARRLGIAPWRCIAIVGSSDMARAAHRASCQVLGIGDARDLNGADKVVKSLGTATPSRLASLFFSESKTWYADVAVNIPIQRSYTYRVPAELLGEIAVGAAVRVPVRDRRESGVVVRLSLHTTVPKQRLKSIERILSPGYRIPPDLLALGEWIASYYLAGPGETLSTISFFGLYDEKVRTERRLTLRDFEKWEDVPLDDAEALATRGLPKLTVRQRDVVRFFLDEFNAPVTRAELMRREGCSAPVVDALLEKGALEEAFEAIERNDGYQSRETDGFEPPLELNPEQRAAFDRIREAMDAKRFEAFLLYGITGSGKTEVYLQSIALALEAGREAIVLVPEISLTPQAVDRFRRRFGARVGVYHSNLSRGQKYDLWRRIESGAVKVLIGARSAIFAPFPNLGLIVVDEEHEHSYKQSDPAPRYHARDVAVWRARFAGVPAILGSATPSLETMHNARSGRFVRLDLLQRVGEAQLPDVRLIDMSLQVRDHRETGLISPPLHQAIAERLARHEQVILFLNRRGFSNFLLCMACRTPIRCPHCDVVMTWHKAINRLMCHMCGELAERPPKCPECGEGDLAEMGAGTQRIEEEVAREFPDARVLRIDLDTAGGRHGFLRMWETIEKGEADILLGTQMIAKGLHLERVTLVGVISADHALFLPDFRASERAFAMLTQVAGRAGRMQKKGEVFIQTFLARHYAIQRAVQHDTEGFLDQELHMRSVLRFPPHWRLLLARLSGEDPELVRKRAERLGTLLRDRATRNPNAYREVHILGPVPSPIARISDQTRWQVVLRGKSPASMRNLLYEALATFDREKGRSAVHLVLDMDPMDLL
jgi:primosomal protein N' (replication factor Y)